MTKALNDRDPRIGVESAYALYCLTGETGRSVRVLTASLESPDADARRGALLSLYSIGQGAIRAAEGIVRCFGDEDARVRSLAITALRAVTALDPAYVSNIAALLTDRERRVRVAAEDALVAYGVRAVPVMRRELSAEDKRRVLASIRVLKRIGGGAQAALPQVKRFAGNGSPEIRKEAEEAVRRIEQLKPPE
jgi:HEAT repeat protein